MNRKQCPGSAIRVLSLFIAILALSAAASAEWKEKVLYSFQGYPDGATPMGGVVFDKHGNLYGASGGGSDSCPSTGDCGVVYQLSPSKQQRGGWIETVLYTFKGYNQGDGATPGGGLILDAAGNLYGVTAYGGTGKCAVLGTTMGCGSVFRLTPPKTKGGAWTEKVLYSFQGDKDGQFPVGDLVFDQNGNLYGATYFGGGFGSCDEPYYHHCGTVFELIAPKAKDGKWTENLLYSFKSGKDGANPNGGLIFDSKGALYGTTYFGGDESKNCQGFAGGTGCGTIFEVVPPINKSDVWRENILHRFKNGQTDGALPSAALLLDDKGSLYGVTTGGGGHQGGILFKLTPPLKVGDPWAEYLLHQFSFGLSGEAPRAALTFDRHGNLYGTASGGGKFGGGTAFEFKPARKGRSSKLVTLYAFKGGSDGSYPSSTLVLDDSGNVYGTAQRSGTGQNCGSYGCGVVFEVQP
jgi:uncharacterized repeat protein (TIGR03803 family)